jgi:hypothetical protein
MSSNLNPDQFYWHASFHDFKPGDRVLPAAATGAEQAMPSENPRDVVYVSRHLHEGRTWAHELSGETGARADRYLYKVRIPSGEEHHNETMGMTEIRAPYAEVVSRGTR